MQIINKKNKENNQSQDGEADITTNEFDFITDFIQNVDKTVTAVTMAKKIADRIKDKDLKNKIYQAICDKKSTTNFLSDKHDEKESIMSWAGKAALGTAICLFVYCLVDYLFIKKVDFLTCKNEIELKIQSTVYNIESLFKTTDWNSKSIIDLKQRVLTIEVKNDRTK